jgi:hypothetical protein
MALPHFGMIESSIHNLLWAVIVADNQVFELSADLDTSLRTPTAGLCTVAQSLFLAARNVLIGEIFELSIQIIIWNRCLLQLPGLFALCEFSSLCLGVMPGTRRMILSRSVNGMVFYQVELRLPSPSLIDLELVLTNEWARFVRGPALIQNH